LRQGRSKAVRRAIASAAIGGVSAFLALGCGAAETGSPVAATTASGATDATGKTQEAQTCEDVEDGVSAVPSTYRGKGKKLEGDVDGDGARDRVALRADDGRPGECRYVLVVETGAGSIVAPVPPLDWPGTDPELLLLAEIDGRPGLESVVTMSPLAVYQPGAVFTVREGELARMRVAETIVPELFPFYDEFPSGVDCADEPGTIVVTVGNLAEGGTDDTHWDIIRSSYRVDGSRFEPVHVERLRVDVGPEAVQRWPEVKGDPFLSCAGRVV
jgi:hypothetical protein